MFTIKLNKFSHIDVRYFKSIVLSRRFKTKRAAIAYLESQGFTAGEKARKLPNVFRNNGACCSAYIFGDGE